MNLKAWIPLCVAIVLGLIAALMAMKLTTPTRSDVIVGETVKVVTAGRNINPGEALRPDDLTLRPIATIDAPEGTFLHVAELEGRVAQFQMVKGQPVLDSLLAPQGAAAGLQALVPQGMRAITIEVDEFSGLAGMIVPTSRVDVLSTIRGDGEGSMARTIVQNVEVKAVGQRVAPRQEMKLPGEQPLSRSVTLLVTPEQAETIELAAVTSRPRLVLRGSKDDATAATRGVTMVDLRGNPRESGQAPMVRPVIDATDPFDAGPAQPSQAPASPPATSAMRQIEIIRGGAVSHVSIEDRRPGALITGVSVERLDGK